MIEVSESTLRFDLGDKAELYAAAGISDYWVVDVAAHSIVVHRDPAAGRYRDVRTYRESDELQPATRARGQALPAWLWQASDQ